LVVVGRDRGDPLVDAANAYLKRVDGVLPAEVVELREVPLRKSSTPEQVMKLEAERIEAALAPGERVIALDGGGRSLSSEALADRLEQARMTAVPAWCFVIGGPSGLHARVLERADERWSLSSFTLPHRLARLVLSEQIYRAVTILRGEPYHK
jgi:23S rRNA (pseudouridine1915-N3)-methyltransferase